MNFPFKMRGAADFDAVGFGTNAVDYLIRVADFPAFDSKVEFLDYERDAGGEVASALAGLTRLGLRTTYAGRFGDDAESELGLQSLVREGVDVTYAERINGASTQTAFIIVDDRTGERTIMWNRDKRLAYEPDSAPVEAVARCKVLHMTPHDTAACLRMAKEAKRNSAITSLDIDNAFEGIDELLPFVDILIGSSDLPSTLTGSSDREAALTTIHERYGCAVVGMTLGSSGSLFLCQGEAIATAAFNVPGGCRDTTGAGDAFRAGFLYGLLSEKSFEESCVLANGVAALKCRLPGARAGLPNLEQLKLFMK